ncbi:alkylhydroperoxidase AhpD family core domain-containing protein [Sinosporangium album]|uniref:Alkylhydroperoxidase AhpD family core domain-containing protein n=1 Tax=Sinosporangium album TaxID=504805 RepID=A0A1G7RBS6_9ACTN|nr:carboxymuconolactone decarboxylase family protein [Sinosporangium album]SDG08228.1 alkylhydroperoxidase AhpD family core domain-containing protein [Sinosporangium album]
MTARLNVLRQRPEAYKAMVGLEEFLRDSGLSKITMGLVKLRVSQINGCGLCVDMHSRELRKAGETDDRLFNVPVWREAPWFTDAERAALALAEEGTRLADRPEAVPDEVWREAAKHFDEDDLSALIVAIATINAWNRIAVITRMPPGSHQKSS